MKARRVRKKSRLVRVLITSIIISIFFLITIYLYTIYQNIDIDNSKYEVDRVVSTKVEETVENREEKNKSIADIVEESMECVVGISKLKDNGTSIFSSSDESSLGLGTGIIVTENGYILSNEHVTR